jgi:hypothetical protein
MECSVNFSSTRSGSGGKIRASASIRQGLEPVESRVSTDISATVSKIVSVGFKPPIEAFSSMPPDTFGAAPTSSTVTSLYLEDTAETSRVNGNGSIPVPLSTKSSVSDLSLRSLRFGQLYIDKTGISSSGTISFYINGNLVATKTADNNDFFLYVNIETGDILRIQSSGGAFDITALSLIPDENVDFKIDIKLRQLDSIYVGEKKSSSTYGGEYFDTKLVEGDEEREKYRIAAFTTGTQSENYAFGFGPNPKVIRFGGATDTTTDYKNALDQNPSPYKTLPKAMISNKKIDGFVYTYGESDYTSDIRAFGSFAGTNISAVVSMNSTDTPVIADKYGGHPTNFTSYKNGFPATQVFYPQRDIESVNLVDKTLSSKGLLLKRPMV